MILLYLKKLGAFFWKTVFATLLCQGLLTSVLVVGWTYRAMQRAALKRWMKEQTPNATLAEAAPEIPAFQHLSRWPNWFRASKPEESRLKRWFSGFWSNFRLGFAGLLTTWSLTILPMLFWNMSWYAGWNNSFNKGYEQAAYGPLLGLSGVLLFMIVMLYVPMAQARHAISGEWRSFYDFKTVRTIARERPVACLLLAAAFSLFSFPIMFLKSAPMFLDKIAPQTADMDARELLTFLNGFYFWVCLLGFGLYVALRLWAARVYAGGLMRACARGSLTASALTKFELDAFKALRVRPPGHAATDSVWLPPIRRGFSTAIAAAALFVWFTFVAQIYVSEFLNYHPIRGWLNQPLVNAPWFSYIPQALREAASALEGR